MPVAVDIGDADGQAVRIRIVRDHEFRVGGDGRVEGEVKCPRLFRVGEGHGGECCVRLDLEGDDGRLAEPRLDKHPVCGLPTDAM